MKIIITESHLKKIIDLLNDDIKPLQKLMECKVTKDFKYILFDGKFYSTKTGNEVTLNEGWLTNVLQTGGDLISMGLDFMLPGTGAVVDTLIGIGMIIAAQFKTGEEQDSLYLMAAIQFALVLLPGPLQLIGTTLRRAVKTGKGLATPVVKKGLGIISGSFTTIMNGLNTIVQKALSSPLAKKVIGKWGKKINEFITKFKNRVKTIFDSFKTNKAGRKVTGQDLNKQNAFGTTGPIVPGQDVAGKNLKSGVGGVKRPGEIQQTNSQIVSSPQTNQDSIFQITPNQNKLPSQNTFGNQTTANQNKLSSKTYNDDHVQIWSGPSKNVPNDYAQIWYNPKQNSNSMIVSKKQNTFTTAKPKINSIPDTQFINNFKKGDVGFPKNLSELSAAEKNNLKVHQNNMINNSLDDMNRKVQNIANKNFNPKNVTVLNKSHHDGRDLLEVKLENGEKIMLYSSSGSNEDTTGKKAGEWFIIPGFMDNVLIKGKDGKEKVVNDWFVKTQESVDLTKGGNNYLTQMAQFLEKNGINALG